MRRIAALSLLFAMPLTAMADGFAEFEELPGLPVSAIHSADNAARQETQNLAQVSSDSSYGVADATGQTQTKHKVTVKPGVNEIIPISVGHPNRILMPFENPKIRTTSNAGFDVEGRAVYVTSNDEGRPVTAFVNDAGNSEVALSLTFVPKRMPPVEVELLLENNGVANAYRSTKKAQAWEESQPYVTTLRDLLRDVAIGETPQGYSLSERPNAQSVPQCIQSGLRFDFVNGQELTGHRLRVNVGIVENMSGHTVEFREPSCSGSGVKAVAAWPNPLLEPGQKTEVYVVQSITQPAEERHNVRRSLLGE